MAQRSRWWVEVPRRRERGTYNPHWRDLDPRWAALRDEHLLKHPRCAALGPTCQGRREVHHVGPKHLYPELRYHPGNLITLCEYHHLWLGHGGEYGAWNPHVRSLAERCRCEHWTPYGVELRGGEGRIWRWLPFHIQGPSPRRCPQPSSTRPGILRRVAYIARRLLFRASLA